MARKPYRVETSIPTKGKPRFFLVRDVKVGDRKSKVRKYLGLEVPTAEKLEKIRREVAPEMELRTAILRAKLTIPTLRTRFLSYDVLKQLEEVRSIHNSVLDLLTADEIRAYEEQFELNYVAGTTSIEGNTLTTREAIDLLEFGKTPKGKALREINEVQNFKQVIAYRQNYKRRITLEFIRRLHGFILTNIDSDSAGFFRRADDVGIRGSDLRVSPALLIEQELQEAIDRFYDELERGFHPFESAVLFHHRFEAIHPFNDGNGRVGREVFNFMLARTKYPRLLFLGAERSTYIDALRAGDDEDQASMVQAFAEIIVAQRLEVLRARLAQLAGARKPSGQKRITDFVAME